MVIRIIKTSLFLLFLSFGLNKAKAGADQHVFVSDYRPKESIMSIVSLTKLLLNEKTTIYDLGEAIGQILEKRGGGYWLASNDKLFSDVWLGIDVEPTGETPRYLKLLVSPEAALRIDELTRVFGAWKSVPPEPDGDVFIISYRYDEVTSPFLGLIYVSLTEEPNATQSRIKKITIRREERI